MTQQSTDQSPPQSSVSIDTDRDPSDDDWEGLWPFIWILFGFKVAMLVCIVWFATRSREDISILAATHWFFLLIPMFAVIGPLAYQWRLRKVRRRRAQLQAQEWMIDELRNTR
jgi:hypothetical protein